MQLAGATLSMTTGLPVCAMCVAREGLSSQQGRAIRSLAYGSLGGALATAPLTFCLCGLAGVAMCVVAIVSGVRALMLLGQPDYRDRSDRGVLMAASIGGIVVAGMILLTYLLAMMGAVGSALLRGR